MMKLAFILDPLDRLNPAKDTSIAIMRAAQRAGHQVTVLQQHELYLNGAQAELQCRSCEWLDDGSYHCGDDEILLPSAVDAIVMRKDPPFDNEYLYSTYLLDIAAEQGTRVLNAPAAIRSWNEKLAITRFAAFTPPFLVTANQEKLLAFLESHQDIVVKPLDGMGGRGIFRLRTGDPNIGAILETSTNFGQQTIMAQRFIPEITQGDKRILLIDGEPMPYSLARIPKTGETRGNLAAGGTGVAQALSERDLAIATAVGAKAKAAGHFLVGLDVIGDYLTEVNVTSPTGMVEIAKQTLQSDQPCNPAEVYVDKLTQLIAENR